MKLKIFSDQSYLPEGIPYEPILYPFWGKPPENPDFPLSGRFDNYVKLGHSLFEMSSLEEADLAIVPSNWERVWDSERQNLSLQFLDKANQAGKLTVSFFKGDCSHLEPVKSDLVFRHSLYRSTRKATDFAICAWSGDFIKKDLNNQFIVRHKQSKPIVGFCGFSAPNNLKTYLKILLHKGQKLFYNQKDSIPPYNIGHALRCQALSILSKSPLVETNFLERQQVFFQGANSNLQQSRAEFVQNIIDSDYVLCCRGSGNFSFRFYEALCCGRIPVFIDTDCVLPYDFEIDWKKYCIWVDESELPLITEKIADFHENISPEEFVDLQHECRKIWEQRLSPEGFFANLYHHPPIGG